MDLKAIQNLTQTQHGVIARYQLTDLGIHRSSITRLGRNGTFISVDRGVYKTIGSPDTWLQRAAIATLSCGRYSALSHESVLILFGLLVPFSIDKAFNYRSNFTKPNIHVVSNRVDRFENNTHHHRSLSISKSVSFPTHYGIRHVSIERALIDNAGGMKLNELDFVLEKAIQKRLISPKNLKLSLDEIRTAPGREKSRLHELLDNYLLTNGTPAATESVLEKRVQKILRKNFPYKFKNQYEIRLSGKSYRLDFADPKKKVVIEVDGFEYHRSRHAFDNDRIRQNALVADGWKIVRLTSKFNDDQIIKAVGEAMFSK